MMAIKRLLRFDWAMKKLLRNKANFEVLEGFLSELLYEDIKIVKILESEGNQENIKDKYNRVDILIENSKDELVIVEIQNDSEFDYFRYFHFLGETQKEQMIAYLELGAEYAKLKKVISVSLVYFDLGEGTDYVYHGQTGFYGLRQKDQLRLNPRQKTYLQRETVESVFPEYYLVKPHSFGDQIKDGLDEWIYTFKYGDTPENFTAKGLAKAKQVLDVMQLSREEQKIYQRYLEDMSYEKSISETIKFEIKYEADRIKNLILEQGREQGIKEGIEQGIKEGITQGVEQGERKREKEIAKNLLQNNVPLDIIITSTGLSLEEIEGVE
jgi:predicted transposase/invertase (TIGR01784 family)